MLILDRHSAPANYAVYLIASSILESRLVRVTSLKSSKYSFCSRRLDADASISSDINSIFPFSAFIALTHNSFPSSVRLQTARCTIVCHVLISLIHMHRYSKNKTPPKRLLKETFYDPNSLFFGRLHSSQ